MKINDGKLQVCTNQTPFIIMTCDGLFMKRNMRLGLFVFLLLAYLGPTAPLCSPFEYGKVSELVGGEDPYEKTAVFFQFQLNSCSEGHMASCSEGHFLSIVFGRTL